MTFRILTAASIATLMVAAPAVAQTADTATTTTVTTEQTRTAQVATDLNLRAGPGPNFAIEGTMPAESTVELKGCIESGAWCEINFEGQSGYAYAPYLVVEEDDQLAVVSDVTTVTTIESVEANEDNGATALIGGGVGAGVASALIGGPAAIVGGALVGSLAGATVNPEVETLTYVESNPVEPVIIEGEPIVGAVIPQEVVLAEVPESDYLYTNLNGQPVLVNAEDRAIVYIVR
ncbi:DUF1236 domain-containing protein [Jannaschia marina]|uniref:DUF1236 domain-containing protein n=1 Tax=Jannaschia marina TaxID=2741674 RepID=UPI0015CD82F2|nr:DUF1236 domain-containing protein [Jannaschia marina]